MSRTENEPRPGLVRLVEEQITFPTHRDIAAAAEQLLARYEFFTSGSEAFPRPQHPSGEVPYWSLVSDVQHGTKAFIALAKAGVLVQTVPAAQEHDSYHRLDRDALDRYLG